MESTEIDNVETRLKFTRYIYSQTKELAGDLGAFYAKARKVVSDSRRGVQELNALLLQTYNRMGQVNELIEFFIKEVLPRQLLYSEKYAKGMEEWQKISGNMFVMLKDLICKLHDGKGKPASKVLVCKGITKLNATLEQNTDELLAGFSQIMFILYDNVQKVDGYFPSLDDACIEERFRRQLEAFKQQNQLPLQSFADDTAADAVAALRYLRRSYWQVPIVKEYMRRTSSIAVFFRRLWTMDYVEPDLQNLYEYMMKEEFLLGQTNKKVIGHKDAKNGIFCEDIDREKARQWLMGFDDWLNYVVQWYAMFRFCKKIKVLREDCKLIEFGRQWTLWTGDKRGERAMYKTSNLPAQFRYYDIDDWNKIDCLSERKKKRGLEMIVLLKTSLEKFGPLK